MSVPTLVEGYVASSPISKVLGVYSTGLPDVKTLLSKYGVGVNLSFALLDVLEKRPAIFSSHRVAFTV